MTSRASRRVCVWREDILPGSETFILNQTRALRRWTPVLTGVRTCAGGLAVAPDFTVQGNQALAYRLDRRLYWNVGTSVRLHRHLLSTSLVHAHFGPDGMQIARASRLARRPLVCTFHGYDALSELVDYSDLFRQSVRLIAVSEFIRGKLIDKGAPEAKVTVAPIGIPVRPDTPDARRGDHLLFVGRLIPQKGCADLLEALSGIDGAPPLLVIGDGPQRAGLEQLAQRLRVKATFAGARDPEYVARAMGSAIAFCVPSKREGLGMVFLEAAAARLPVVSYSSGGIPEAVIDGETGFLAPEGDVSALAERVRHVVADAELAARLGAAGRRRVEAQFEIRRRAAQLELLYDAVVEEARPAVSSRVGVA